MFLTSHPREKTLGLLDGLPGPHEVSRCFCSSAVQPTDDDDDDDDDDDGDGGGEW